MTQHLRLNEYKVLLYRLSLAYFFYFISRLLFYVYNMDLLEVDSLSDFLSLCFYGLTFDTTAIFYVNILFIALSIFPVFKNTNQGYQKFLFYLYFGTNLLAYATNFIDFIYYKFTFARTTIVFLSVLENETNKSTLFLSFLNDYWHVWVLFLLFSALWVYLYKKVVVKEFMPVKKVHYFGFSLVGFVFIGLLTVFGIRGWRYEKKTQPINLMDANSHVKNIAHVDIVLNTPFTLIRTMFTNHFAKTNYKDVNEQVILEKIMPIKQYHKNPVSKPNVVIMILESFSREYIGALNKNSKIPNYESHVPFLDSLAQHSLVFTNAYANGRQSVHAMSAILAGIPSFKDAFTSSPYPKQKIESLVSVLESQGYNTSFFHGAANGSMGFLGFGNILGIDNYYGRTEYNNDSKFDGFWGIWDEDFLKYMKKTLDKKKTPFFATAFTLSSHEPFLLPEKYKGKFREGGMPIHKCVEYTDYALKQFFKEAKKESWFKNTIFVFVADHCNKPFYDEYKKPVNRFAIPIIIYKPTNEFVGVDNDLAQQIDIYPTILDIIGYSKPFRSWGRSLFDKTSVEPFVINSTGSVYQFLRGNYICTFDGKKALGFYDKDDKALKKNLIAKRNAEMDAIELNCKAFIQDYMQRIIDKKLTSLQ